MYSTRGYNHPPARGQPYPAQTSRGYLPPDYLELANNGGMNPQGMSGPMLDHDLFGGRPPLPPLIPYRPHFGRYNTGPMPGMGPQPGPMGYSGGEIIPYGGQNAMDMVHQCTGRKRALLIGINYIGQSHPLKGCINDAYRMRDLLTSLYNFHDNDMVILTDDNPDPRAQPTRTNLIRAMHWLVANAQPTDSYFFHYSGHGTQTVDVSGDEIDGYDETILPVDFRTAGMILDDEMNAIMVRLLPLGCRLTAVFDSCHSGTALDLPFVYDYRGRLEKHPIVDATRDALGRVQTNYMAGDYYMAGRSVLESLRTVVRGPAIRRRQLRSRSTLGDVVMFSGCADDESSADSYDYALGNTGAMSNALVMVLRNNPNQSYAQILRGVRDILRGRYNQRPQLSTGRYMDMNRMFIL